MNVTYHKASTIKELQQIIALQSENLHANLTEEVRQQQGFVSVSHTLKILQEMNKVCPHTIAKSKHKVIGYALCMHPSFSDDISLLKPMFVEINSLIPKPKNFMVMGQICIDKEFRGKGVFRNLYKKMKEDVLNEYHSIITEVDSKNLRSLNAHTSVGFKHLKTYNSLGQDWKLLILRNS
ncbi:GNAT family N-acetyltransferase [uncultured Maribacter sp.]|uniref:GNAT family N-acetyltransferase n=1 Tax=uncultured Maribacter sp. TaxID=431308 RepID=UPI002629011A|nr:GNAT family N-acetyltransferase [uncultured Maribacter sp.]